MQKESCTGDLPYRPEDALGSVRAITDSAGSVAAHYEYDAWGNLLPSSADMTPSFAYRFSGAFGVRWDYIVGFSYMRKRWYDPTLQRFVSRDFGRLPNSYYFGSNNPTNLGDPFGLFAIPPDTLKKCPGLQQAIENLKTDITKPSLSQILTFYTPSQYQAILNSNIPLTWGKQPPCDPNAPSIEYGDASGGINFEAGTSFNAVTVFDAACAKGVQFLESTIIHEITHVLINQERDANALGYHSRYPKLSEKAIGALALAAMQKRGLCGEHPAAAFAPAEQAFPTRVNFPMTQCPG